MRVRSKLGNTRAKGKRLEKLAKEILEANGYLVEQANPKLQFIGPGKVISKAHDLYGLWDFMAVRKSGYGGVNFYQVGVWEHHATKKKLAQTFPWSDKYQCYLWLWYAAGKNGHFRVCSRETDYDWVGLCEMPVKKTKSDVVSSR